MNGENGLTAMEDVLLQILLLKGQGHVIHLQSALVVLIAVHLPRPKSLTTVSASIYSVSWLSRILLLRISGYLKQFSLVPSLAMIISFTYLEYYFISRTKHC